MSGLLQIELKDRPEFGLQRRRGVGVSVGVHVVLFLLVLANPEFLKSTPTRVIRITGQDYDRDRFEDYEVILPPDAIVPVPEPPQVAEVQPPEIPQPTLEAAPPPPPPPPPPDETPPPLPPPPVIGPDDVIAEGARPDGRGEVEPEPRNDAPAEAIAGAETGVPEQPSQPEGSAESELSLEVAEAGARPEPTPFEESPEPPENTNPDALLLPDFRQRAETIVEENLARDRRSAADGRRSDISPQVQEMPDFTTEEPTILSDTRGYDFGPYMNQVVNRVRVNWYSLIPQAARLRQSRGRVVLIFTITQGGDVTDLRVVADSGTLSLDRAATAAITASNPFPRLPDDYDDNQIVLQFTFLYNMN